MQEIISARQAAKVLGCMPQKVRVRMQSGHWKIGEVIERRGQPNAYDIHVHKLSSFFGISLEEIERRLNT